MAQLHYVGKNGDPALDAERIEAIRLQNAIARTRLQKLNGDVIDRREVEFVISSALVALRTKILQLPKLIVTDLQGRLENAELHGVKLRVEGQVDRALTELAADLEKAVTPKAFIGELAGEDTEGEEAKSARARKETQAKARRTAKRHEKARKNEG